VISLTSTLHHLVRDVRDTWVLWCSVLSARRSKIKNDRLDQYDTEPCEQQQFRTAGIEGVKTVILVKKVNIAKMKISRQLSESLTKPMI